MSDFMFQSQSAGGSSSSTVISRNYAFNSQFRFWQRQAPGTLTSRQDDQYSADRWYLLNSGGAVNIQGARVEESPSSGVRTRYIAQFRNADGSARQFGPAQIIPANDCWELRGQTVTFGFLARTDSTEITTLRAGIVEWTGTADSVTSDIVSSWSATPTLIANAAFINTPADITINSTLSQYSVSATLGTTFNNLIIFIWTPNTEAQNDDFYLGQIQLVKSSTVLDYDDIDLSYEEDLAQCAAFYQKSYNVDTAPGTVTAVGQISKRSDSTGDRAFVQMIPTMFATPVVTTYNPNSGASGTWRDISAPADKTYTATNPGQRGSAFNGTSTVDGNVVEGHWTAEAEM